MHCTEKGVYRRRREEEKKIEFEDHVKLIRRKEKREFPGQIVFGNGTAML